VLPTANSSPAAITTGPDGAVWFILQASAKIGRLTPALSYMEYDGCPPSGRCELYDIVSAGDRIWFTDGRSNSIRSIDKSGGNLTDHFPPSLPAGPYGLTVGPDGNLWFTEATASKIGYIVISSATFGAEFVLTGGSQPRSIVSGSDGNLWFTESFGNRIGRATPTGKIGEAPIPTADSSPLGITGGPDGNIWFVEYSGSKVGRINLKKP
jgi:virginiamycin B lyase